MAERPTQESVLRTTDRGAPRCPPVPRETGARRSWASRNAATGSAVAEHIPTGARSDSGRVLLANLGTTAEQTRVGRVHAAGDERGQHGLHQVARG